MNAQELKLRDEMARVATQMRGIVDKAEAENRGLSGDEETTWRNLVEAHEGLEARLERVRSVANLPTDDDPAESRGINPGNTTTAAASADDSAKAYRAAFDEWARFGSEGMSPEQRAILRNGMMAGDDLKELRAQGIATGGAGGYTVPQDFAGFVTEARRAFGGLRAAAGQAGGPTLIQTERGNALPFPTLDETSVTGALLGENVQASVSDMTFGQVQLDAYKYTSGIVLVPIELMQDEAVGLEALIGRALGVRLGRITATHYATGTGTAQPHGIATAASTTAAAGAAAITWDDLVTLKHAVDPAYRPAARFVFNDATFRALKLLKDADSRPIWQPQVASEVPATIDGDQYIIEQGLANIGTGNRSVVYGDLSGFYIREVMGYSMLRLVERYADFGQVGFIGFMRADSGLVATSSVRALAHP